MVVRELFGALGLDVDEKAFAVGAAAFGGIAAAAQAFLTVIQAVAAFVPTALSDVTAQADRLEELAEMAGVTTDEFQKFAFATRFAGLSVDETQLALSTFAKKNPGKDVAEGLLELADQMERLPGGAARVKLATDNVGRSGTKLIPVLSKGREAVKAYFDEFDRSGRVMSKEQISKFAEFADQVERLKFKWQGLRQTIAVAVLPGALKVVNFLLEKIPIAVERIQRVFKGLGQVVELVLRIALNPLSLAIVGMVAAFWALASGSAAAGAAMIGAGLRAAAAWALAALPIILIAGLLALLILVIEDVQVMLEGGESFIGKLGAKWADFVADWMEPAEGDHWLVRALKVFFGMFADLETAWDDAVTFWQERIMAFVVWVGDTIRELGSKILNETAGWFDFIPGVGRGDIPLGPQIFGIPAPTRSASGGAGAAPTTVAPRFEQHIQINGSSLTPAQLSDSVTKSAEEFMEKHFRQAFVGVSQ